MTLAATPRKEAISDLANDDDFLLLRHDVESPAREHQDRAAQDEPPLSPQKRAALRRSWARLIRRVYLTDPLKCECGGELRVIAFITERNTIRTILSHLEARTTESRAPP